MIIIYGYFNFHENFFPSFSPNWSAQSVKCETNALIWANTISVHFTLETDNVFKGKVVYLITLFDEHLKKIDFLLCCDILHLNRQT